MPQLFSFSKVFKIKLCHMSFEWTKGGKIKEKLEFHFLKWEETEAQNNAVISLVSHGFQFPWLPHTSLT